MAVTPVSTGDTYPSGVSCYQASSLSLDNGDLATTGGYNCSDDYKASYTCVEVGVDCFGGDDTNATVSLNCAIMGCYGSECDT
jgi:hypothetical protein